MLNEKIFKIPSFEMYLLKKMVKDCVLIIFNKKCLILRQSL
jgi:hypothetical protein